LSFPATTRQRWGITDGGDVEVFDLGDAVVILPGGTGAAKRALAKALTRSNYAAFRSSVDDVDLRDE
jgi:bifunctional DNA-binding transcriptional regulator/antitoxin component of YhaV-PrlF toxin-antitoxin module